MAWFTTHWNASSERSLVMVDSLSSVTIILSEKDATLRSRWWKPYKWQTASSLESVQMRCGSGNSFLVMVVRVIGDHRMKNHGYKRCVGAVRDSCSEWEIVELRSNYRVFTFCKHCKISDENRHLSKPPSNAISWWLQKLYDIYERSKKDIMKV